MKALSFKQPWAWAVLNGKPIENRIWHTRYRGPFLIHASGQFDYDGWLWLRKNTELLKIPRVPEPAEYHCSGFVGYTEITDCVESDPSPWFFGPYGFKLANTKPIPFIPGKGALNFFETRLELNGGGL